MMKKLFLISLLVLTPLALLATPASSSAQQPKLDIKLVAGASGTTFVSMLETGRQRDTFLGWQVGFGPRVRRRHAFIEVLLSFNRFAFIVPEYGTLQVNSFELPFNMGYIPYQNSYFKLFLYGGYVNHFNTHLIVRGTGLKVRPQELDPPFAIYQAIIRLGANFDLAMFNVDFNYSISLNSATTTSYRTGYHQLQFNLAYLF